MSVLSGWRTRLRSDGALLACAAAALVLALLDPALTLTRPRPDLVLAVDITQSMAVPDASTGLAGGGVPDGQWPRLAAVRAVLHQALARLPCGSEVGLAVFTEYRSYLLLAPLEVCAHLAELRATVAAIDNRMAWAGNSEVAKGLHSAWTLAGALPGKPALVFITDGHESPPLSPRHRPRFDDDKPGEQAGLIVGVGGLKPQPIPKVDPQGRPLGEWAADEVLQTDPRSRGRGGSVGGEAMADEAGEAAVSAAALGAMPGSEHLSALREAYLQRLAAERGLAYHRLQDVPGLMRALREPALARPVPVRVSLAPAALLVALAALMVWQRAALAGLWPARWRPLRAARGARTPPPRP